MSDNELDNLFKEAADGYKAPNDPSAWQAMSRKLDQAAVVTSFWNWKTLSSLTVLGVTGIALIVYVSVPDSTVDQIAASHVTLNQVIEQKPAESKSIVKEKEANATADILKKENNLGVEENVQTKSNDPAIESNVNSKRSIKTRQGSDAQSKNSKELQTRISQQNELSEKVKAEKNQSSIANSAVSSQDKVASSGSKTEQAALIAEVAVTEKTLDSKSTSGSPVENQTSVTVTEERKKDEIASAENKSGQAVLITGAAVTEKSLDSKTSSSSITNDKNSNQNESVTKSSNFQTENSLVATDSLKKHDEEKIEPPATLLSKTNEQPKAQEEKSDSFNRFAIKLAVAPDYTTVKSATPNSLGINYGVLFEYRISKHWSVATGGIWSKKIYSAYDVEYGGYNADWVDGDCRMWDIPVNVYYNFSSQKPFSFYASLGFSSYLMNEENYVYYVETPYGTYDYPKQVKGENNEWFKTFNVSAGMQFRMSQNFSLQFEPTLKAPLAGVGEGEVSLVSLGAFLNLRYEIPINKTRRNED